MCTSVKNKILILPTYFPTKEAPIIGSMVREQAILMQEFFDIRVVYCLPGMGIKRFIIHIIFGSFFSQYRSCDDQILSDPIIAKGVYYFQSKLFSKKINNKIKNLAYKYVVKDFIKDNWRPDLIHSRTAEYTGLQALYLSRSLNIPNLLTENCIFIQDESITNAKIREYRTSIEGATKVAVVSHYLKAFLLSHKFKCDPNIIGNMVDDDLFKLKKQNKNNNEFIILTAAHTGYTKDWDTFFKTIHFITSTIQITNIKVEIAVTQAYGDSSLRYLSSLAAKYNVDSHCHFNIQVPREKMVDLYHEANIFLATSVNETFGIATLEAMFCGVPVVSTRNGGIEDFSTPENSILCDIGDYKALGQAIINIHDKRISFEADKIRESVIHRFGKNAFKHKLKKLYEDTIALTKNHE